MNISTYLGINFDNLKHSPRQGIKLLAPAVSGFAYLIIRILSGFGQFQIP